MSAPTETEIRAAIAEALLDSDIDIGRWVADLSIPVQHGLWADLRPSEADRLANLIEGVYTKADDWQHEVEEKITEAIVAAALTFADEYPDAPLVDEFREEVMA